MHASFLVPTALLMKVASVSPLHGNSTAAEEGTELCLIVRLTLLLLCDGLCSTVTNEYRFSLLSLAQSAGDITSTANPTNKYYRSRVFCEPGGPQHCSFKCGQIVFFCRHWSLTQISSLASLPLTTSDTRSAHFTIGEYPWWIYLSIKQQEFRVFPRIPNHHCAHWLCHQ